MELPFLLSAYLVWLGLCVFASVFQWLTLRVARVPIKTCKLFAGPTIAGALVGGSRVELGCIPVGTSIAFDVPAFRARPTWVRLAVVLVGPCALLTCAVTALGPHLAWHHFLAGFVELPLGAWHPQTLAVHFVGRWHDVLAGSLIAATGVLATKLAALELLPLGGMTTAQVLKQWSNPDEEDHHHWSVTLTTVTALTLWLIMLLWSVAAIFYVVPKRGLAGRRPAETEDVEVYQSSWPVSCRSSRMMRRSLPSLRGSSCWSLASIFDSALIRSSTGCGTFDSRGGVCGSWDFSGFGEAALGIPSAHSWHPLRVSRHHRPG